MGQLIVNGITFLFISKEQDLEHGPYYTSEHFPAIKIYRPNTSKNISEEWFAEDVETRNTCQGSKTGVFQEACSWVKQKELERENLSKNKTTEE